jgi:hypothetical protein
MSENTKFKFNPRHLEASMLHPTRLYVKGAASASTARQLIAAQSPTERAIDQTIEFLGEQRDIFAKEGKYGVTYFVRSSISFYRFLVVLLDVHGYHCSCGSKVCGHVVAAYRYQQDSEVA